MRSEELDAERRFRELVSAIRRGEGRRYSSADIQRILRDARRDEGQLRDLVAHGDIQER